MNETVIVFQKVSFGYDVGRGYVLNELDFSISKGKITAILAPNGGGKTTLLYLALGWLKPKRGLVFVDGRPLSTFNRKELGKKLALVPQSEYSPFAYSVLEVVLLGRAPHLPNLSMPSEADVQIALTALGQAGISSLAEKSITTLSGGERQLVSLARALAQQPEILLLDEPTAHLDLQNVRRLVDILRQLRRNGVTILFSSHDPQVVASLADEVILLKNGSLLTKGNVAETLTAAQLSHLYQIPVIVRDLEGKRFVEWL